MRNLVCLIAVIGLIASAFGDVTSGFQYAYGQVDGRYFKSEVSVERLRKTPNWSPDREEAPPLSPGRAHAIARRQLERIVPSGQKWRLDQVRLIFMAETYCLYEVDFWRDYPEDETVARYGGDRFDILVLLDGTCIEPKPTERPH
jgi:hypothetical protein